MSDLEQGVAVLERSGVARARPLVVALGGTLSAGSSTEKALRVALAGAAAAGADVEIISGAALDMPLYAWERKERTPAAAHLVATLRRADGVILGSPGYHGGISGLVKNALDYTEDMARDDWPYFHGRPVGAVATGAGWQGAVATLIALRGVVHALRGWNTPLGVAINTSERVFDAEGACVDAKIDAMLQAMGREVAQAARVRAMMLQADAPTP
ncbi:NADPH-dependent FMN reductase [Parapedomonas caeni]